MLELTKDLQTRYGTFDKAKIALLNSNSIHYVLKDAIRAFDDADCVDAVKDAATLRQLMELRVQEAFTANAKKLVESR